MMGVLWQFWAWLAAHCRPAAGGLSWDDCVEALPLALVRLDEQGRMIRLNRAWQDLTGYAPRACLQRSHEAYLHIEDQPLWRQALSRPGSGAQVLLLRYLHRGGELRWAEVRLHRLARGFAVSLGDSSEQVQQRQSLRAHHRSLSNLLDGLPLMVYRCRNNRHWSMEYVSAGCLQVTGYQPQQLIDSQSLTFNSLIHPDDRERVWHAVQLGLDERRAFVMHYRLLCADGHERSVLERGCGIYSDAGDLLGLEGVVMDAWGVSAEDAALPLLRPA